MAPTGGRDEKFCKWAGPGASCPGLVPFCGPLLYPQAVRTEKDPGHQAHTVFRHVSAGSVALLKSSAEVEDQRNRPQEL